MPELLLELFSEEIPARMQKRAADDLQRLVEDGLRKARLDFQSSHSYVTPRRLALVITGLPKRQPDTRDERKGPQVGAPERAIKGFLGSLGGLTLDDCEQREIKGKTFWFAVVDRKGRAAAEVLKGIVETVLAGMAGAWPKSMRWGDNAVRWARPLHSIVCILDGRTVAVEFGPVTASDTTSGHRFLSLQPFRVTSFDDYKARLLENKVMLDAAERREKIRADTEALAAAEGLNVRPDEALLDEVAGLVEWPVTLIGGIDGDFMDVPPEVLIAAMRGHQKYFSLLDGEGQPAPRFIFVSNMETADGGKAIIAGNERVLRARLSDAKFFWDQDRKHSLESRLPMLADVVFHAKLGSVLEKVERIGALAAAVCPYIPDAAAAAVERAAKLCKADLVTGMVGEFPELQGRMGCYYTLEDGEDASVAKAIAEHYSPAGPNDRCPTNPVAVAVALADKIDTLIGFWIIDEKPTGSKDPFALRRAALGVIRLIIENELRLPLLRIFNARQGFDAENLLAFFADRLKIHLKEKGVRHDLIDAVFALGEDDIVRVLKRVEALAALLGSDDGANLLVAYRRAANIVRIEEKKDGDAEYREVRPDLFIEAGEDTLWRVLQSIRDGFEDSLGQDKFTESMTALARLRPPVDAFFDNVTVNAEDPELRANRLALLRSIVEVMDRVADFSRIEGTS